MPLDLTKLQELSRNYTAAWCSQNAASVAAFFAAGGSLRINDGTPNVGRPAIAAAAQGFMTALFTRSVLSSSTRQRGAAVPDTRHGRESECAMTNPLLLLLLLVQPVPSRG
jgi:hypothetical protein